MKNFKKYINFKTGFILFVCLWFISNCAGNKLNRQVHAFEIEIEGKNITIDSLQKELDMSKLHNDTLMMELRMLKESVGEYRDNYNILIRSNIEQARTIRRQVETKNE